jgi:hypothetical protein
LPPVTRSLLPVRRFQQRSLDLGAIHMSGEDCDDGARHLVLDREGVVQLAIVILERVRLAEIIAVRSARRKKAL